MAINNKNVKVVKNGDRFIIVDVETGEILDDAQGYGYKTPHKAYRGYYYKKNRESIEARARETASVIENWLQDNPKFEKDFDMWRVIAFEDDDNGCLMEFFDKCKPPFTITQFTKYLDYKWKNKKRKKHK